MQKENSLKTKKTNVLVVIALVLSLLAMFFSLFEIRSDNPLVYMITGQAGPAGQAGLTGQTGATGQAGIAGVTGQTGLVGQAGLTGQTGATGETGTAGATGQAGTAGITGATGQTGTTGSIGETGQSGETGQAGLTGQTGTAGETGATGQTGTIGATGSTGPSFLSVSTATDDINKDRSFVIISGGSFTAGHAYCAMVSAPGVGKTDNFVISVDGTVIGTCTVSDTATFGSATLISIDISPGTVVHIDTNSTGSKRPGSVAIGE